MQVTADLWPLYREDKSSEGKRVSEGGRGDGRGERERGRKEEREREKKEGREGGREEGDGREGQWCCT